MKTERIILRLGDQMRRSDMLDFSLPYRWWRPSFYHLDTAFIFDRTPGCSPKCYCTTGYSTHIRFAILGYGFVLWLGKHTGPIPCPCNEAMHEMRHDPESVLYDTEACDDDECRYRSKVLA